MISWYLHTLKYEPFYTYSHNNYPHLDVKCEFQAKAPPSRMYPWVDHNCVLAMPQQVLLHNKW